MEACFQMDILVKISVAERDERSRRRSECLLFITAVQLHKFRQKFMFHSETAQQCQQFDDHLTPIENRQEEDRETDTA